MKNFLLNFNLLEIHKDHTQHDELEPNLKKILHSNGIWGLEAIVKELSPSNLKKIRFRSPCEKIHKTLLSKVPEKNFPMINEKNL